MGAFILLGEITLDLINATKAKIQLKIFVLVVCE